MTARKPRFEICRGDDGWWARFRAANGRVVFVTETYQRRRGAEGAIRCFTEWCGYPAVIEVRMIDERQP